MTSYAGLDMSQQETQICILDAAGAVRWTGKAASQPAALTSFTVPGHINEPLTGLRET